MNMKQIIPFLFAVSLMISSDSLVVLGNLFGRTGSFGFVCVFAVGVVYLGLLAPFRHYADSYSAVFIKKTRSIGQMEIFVHLLSFFSKSFAVVFLSAGLLVSSGFVFNEVFVYWFPNFGFAFLLLTILTFIQLLPRQYIIRFQMVFAGITILGLMILTSAGFLFAEQMHLPIDGFKQNESIGFTLDALSLLMLIFIGIDMGTLVGEKKDSKDKTPYRSLFITIVIMMILFMLWGGVLLAHVPVDRLAQSSIPHILGAKAILGHSGRMVMGVIIIFGTCCAINALFFSIKEQGSGFIGTRLLPHWIKDTRGIVLFLSVISAGIMFGGLAGHKELETFIHGSLLFWLVSYSAILIWSFTRLKGLFNKFKHIILLIVLVISCITQFLADDYGKLMIIFASLFLFGLLSMGTMIIKLKKK